MDKENIRYTYTQNTTHRGILFIHEEKKILLFVTTRMDTEITMLSEINQTKKDKYCMTSVIFEI